MSRPDSRVRPAGEGARPSPQENTYDLVGNLTQKRLPSGEEYRFVYSSKGALEKSTFPDGTYELTGTDRNGRVTRHVDRRLLEVSARYNKADLLVENLASDATYGLISRVSTHTHLGPASVTESEGGVQKVATSREYHWSGAPTKVTQTVDSLTLTVDYTYDAGGTLISVTPTGSGASPWTQKFNLKPQYHAATPDTDPFNRTAIEKDGAAHVITRESDYLGLAKRIKYGDYASTKGEVALGYDKFLRLATIQSNEGGTPALDITLVRDFGGNILSKEGESFAYDGMNRLVSDDGEALSYDEISNLSARGDRRYSYQSAGEGAQSQMRPSSFDDGSSTWDYTYDNNGNITSISNRFDSLVYDVMNRLREVHFHGSARVDSYWYDGSGLRVKKDENSGTKTYSLYAGENPLVQEEYSGSTRVLTRLNVVDGGQILARWEYVYGTGENVKYFYLDQIGSRRVVKDGTGSVTDKFTYSAWGEATQTAGAAADLASYTGKDYDGTGLLYFNARYYDPTTGRFLTEDPARKGTAYYTYVEDNPLVNVDSDGRQKVDTRESSAEIDRARAIAMIKADWAAQDRANLEWRIKKSLAAGVKAIPVVGAAVDIREALTGREFLTRDPLNTTGRAIAGVSAVLNLLPMAGKVVERALTPAANLAERQLASAAARGITLRASLSNPGMNVVEQRLATVEGAMSKAEAVATAAEDMHPGEVVTASVATSASSAPGHSAQGRQAE